MELEFIDWSEQTRHCKLLATDPSLAGIRIVLGKPLPGPDLEALTRDLEVSFVG